MQPQEEYTHRGLIIKLFQDSDIAESPRAWDNLGTMVCWHSRYTLGDDRTTIANEHGSQFKHAEDFFYDLLYNYGDVQSKLERWKEKQETSDPYPFSAIVNNGYGGTEVAAWEERDKQREAVYKARCQAEAEKLFFILPLYLYDHSGITMNTVGFSCNWDSGQVGYIFVSRKKVLKEYDWKKFTKKRIDQVYERLRQEVSTYDQYLTGDVWGYAVLDGEHKIDSLWGIYGYENAKEAAKEAADAYLNKKVKR